MRWRTPLLLLTLFAALGVLARQVPECLNLSDDVSNDGNLPVLLQEELLGRISAPESRTKSPFNCLAAPSRRKPFNLLAATLDAFNWKSARSLLHLLRVQRK
ncbi:MAG TPA: hypothetical protein VL523_20345 [Terriglobia bacterium]|nr:hypothetical protein [Terriglobia bacterium]